ncbi:MAG TPA: YceI family protein [Gaiellaceae bacterium]|nr:YceI family protein [Gaiellaceae bacterium]
MSAVASTTIIPTGTWIVDPAHTTVGFQVTDTADLFSTIVGRFTELEGRIEGGDEPSFAGAIRVASLHTDNEQRDAHLLSPDFLEGEKHPEIRFRSTTTEPIGDDRLRVRGELSVKDTPFEIELEARVRGIGTGQLGDARIVLDARGSFEWGTTTVELTVAVSAAREA